MTRPTFLMLLLLAGAMGAPLPALAQVVTTFQDNTPLYSSQINSAFGQAVNTQSGTATNLTVNGGTLSGPTISGQVQGAPTFANQSGWLTSLGAASATALANILNGTTPFTALTATGGGTLGGTFTGSPVGNFAQTLNVAVYHQAGDTDYTAAFTRAIAAEPSGGATLFVPPGLTAIISSELTLPANTRLQCGKGGVIQWNGATTGADFQATSGSNFEIEGCTWVTPEGSSYQGFHVLNFQGVTNVLVRDNVSDGGGDFVANIGSTNFYALNNIVTNVSNACYDNWNSFTNTQINFNTCTTLASAGSSVGAIQFTGIATGGGTANSIGYEAIGNDITINGGVAAQAIEINGYPSSGTDDQGRIVGNRITVTGSTSAWGILVTGEANDGEIADNVLVGNAGTFSAIAVDAPATGWSIHDNIGVDWQAGAAGVFTDDGTGGVVSGNEAYGSSSPLIGTSSSTIVFFGNDTGTGVLNLDNVNITSGSAAFSGNLSAIGNPVFGWNGAGGVLAGLNTAAGHLSGWREEVAGVNRFFYGSDGTTESGSNAGSNFIINRYSDTGTLLDAAVTITRATGIVALADGVQLPVTTVAALPACGSSDAGLLRAVSDATAPTYDGALTGGGTIEVPVFCNGSSWSSH